VACGRGDTRHERVESRRTAVVHGDVTTPADRDRGGSQVNGGLEMTKKGAVGGPSGMRS